MRYGELCDTMAYIEEECILELKTRKKNIDDVKSELPITTESYGQLKMASAAFEQAIKIMKNGGSGDNDENTKTTGK